MAETYSTPVIGSGSNQFVRQQKENSAHVAATATRVCFSNQQIEDLQKLLSRMTTQSDLPSANTVLRGSSVFANFADNGTCQSWIVDSGASDHMTGYGLGDGDWQC
ncbi:hypothetical protein HRI_005094500 [Hibiscus trionum]|uniref:Uncharacterized protein n=1 Tax=Hibiscus trionum TaxID=183268 RepID=A0A9W7JGK0_HIBTR|nr:hypothetical protein HRI_005094500 [Hibiscus trionum]